MKIFEHIEATRSHLRSVTRQGLSVGFVPTMGALHEGHLSLVTRAKKENDYVVVSIFVNPIQFNNQQDLMNYPKDVEADIKKLQAVGCDMLFIPSVTEMYPEPVTTVYDLGHLDKVMEGRYRPGHFNGVVIVVRKLFDIIKPDRAYFGEKDFQQLVIIRHMTTQLDLPIKIIACPTVREEDGLAMSSRNMRLTTEQRRQAPFIYRVLLTVKARAGHSTIPELRVYVEKQFEKTESMKIEYFEIADIHTLLPVNNWSESQNIIACIAVYVGEIRLIDNIILFS
jgi:pantoate--beta-alanine ligase